MGRPPIIAEVQAEQVWTRYAKRDGVVRHFRVSEAGLSRRGLSAPFVYAPWMLQFQLQPQNGFVLVHLTGLVTLESWQDVLARVEAAVRADAADRAVFDLGGLVGWLGEPERRAVGALMAERLARMKKVALVVEARKITGVVEEEANRGGLPLRIFSVMDDAVTWVLK